MKKIILSVTNDLVSDKRVNKVAISLQNFGFEVIVVGRKLKSSKQINFSYKTKRLKLLFKKGPLFYVFFNLRLFFYLIFSKSDIFLSNDLDTLLANYFASKLCRKPLVYDSHELFTEVPELISRPKVQKIWKKIENFILPKVKYSYTVCDSIAEIYSKKYGIEMLTVRNIPELKQQTILNENSAELYKKEGKRIIIYQGAINVNRGIEQAVEAMKYIENAVLLIIGDGDIFQNIKNLIIYLSLEKKVKMTGKLHFNELYQYTKIADLGLSIEQNVGLNYFYALPNKLFDYIRAEIPVLTSPFPEMKKIVETYEIGDFIENHEPKHIAEKINTILSNEHKYQIYKQNLKKASEDLTWENEEIILKGIFDKIPK